MKRLSAVLLILFVSGIISGHDKTPEIKTDTGTLLILVRGFKNTDGQLMVALYNKADEFLKGDPYKGSITEISANEELIKFENLPYGDYAVAAIHDMNNDGKLDKNAIGIPTEGYGFSNNVIDKYGPPTFLQASFVFAGRDEAKVIDLEYGIPRKE
jgi:uncharacterized protein (DUF2141 family)